MSVRNKFYFVLIIMIVLASSSLVFASTDAMNFNIPYSSYTFDYWGDPMPAPLPYVTDSVIDFTDSEIGSLRSPRDLVVSENNRVYISDSGNNRVIVFDDEWNVLNVIKEFDNNGELDSFNSPRGLFVDRSENLYVSDMNNGRIIKFNEDGEVIDIIGEPVEQVEGVLPGDFSYRPIKVAVDIAGRMYVLSDDTYEGVLVFDRNGDFRGFIGAPHVRFNLWDQFWRLLATEQQMDRMQLRLPTEYSSIDIDDRGFIYATVIGGTEVEREAIRRLNPSGEDVLRRNAVWWVIGDIGFPDQYDEANITGPSVFTDVLVQDYGVYSVLDRNRGRVFTYDNDGYLLYVFGFRDSKYGANRLPVALDVLNGNKLILDRERNRITSYSPTDYALNIQGAIAAHYHGRYDEANELWREVLRANSNNEHAYTGIGLAYLRQDEFRDAMYYFRQGNNRDYYSEAFGLYRREVLNDILGYIFATIILLYIAFKIYKKKKSKASAVFKEVVAISDEKLAFSGQVKRVLNSLKYSLHVIFHPFDGFWDLKHEKRGNYPAAIIILILTTLTYVFSRQYTGFIFNHMDLTRLNIIMEFASVLLPFLLWCVVNWSMTTLVEGKGTFRDIFIASAYALTPLILINIPLTIVSHMITIDEGAFYYFFLALAAAWAVFLLFFGIMVTHNFDMKKNFFTTLVTFFGMVFVIFLSILFFNLSEQVYTFFSEIYFEIVYRL
ncbi:YIP1 family protein [Natronospora cellulosivora (SeqCode)]